MNGQYTLTTFNKLQEPQRKFIKINSVCNCFPF